MLGSSSSIVKKEADQLLHTSLKRLKVAAKKALKEIRRDGKGRQEASLLAYRNTCFVRRRIVGLNGFVFLRKGKAL